MNHKFSITQSYLLIFFISFVISIVGATYAYFAVTKNNSTSISGDAAMINLNLIVKKILPIENSSGYIVPQKASSLANAMNSGCVDNNNNIVCQVYSVNIKNNSTASVVLDGKISFFGNEQMSSDIISTMPNLKWKLIQSFDENNVTNSVLGNSSINNASSSGGVFSDNLTLSFNQDVKYYLIVWVNEINGVQYDLNSSFYGKVSFIASNGNGVTANFVGY